MYRYLFQDCMERIIDLLAQILMPILWEAFEGIESPVLFFWATRKRYDIPGINPESNLKF